MVLGLVFFAVRKCVYHYKHCFYMYIKSQKHLPFIAHFLDNFHSKYSAISVQCKKERKRHYIDDSYRLHINRDDCICQKTKYYTKDSSFCWLYVFIVRHFILTIILFSSLSAIQCCTSSNTHTPTHTHAIFFSYFYSSTLWP